MVLTPEFKTFHGTKEGKIVEDARKPQELKGNEVLIKITASGVCGTDLHEINNGIVLGHEGVGQVVAFGDATKNNWKVGERVGFGYVKDGCGICEFCLAGSHIHCSNNAGRMYEATDFDQGSFASHAVWPETLLHRIPAGLTDAEAAPLFCAGQTVFMPILRYVRPGDRVGVVGIGGLGHLAIQFASKWGCEVVALSGSESKKAEAIQLGASEFVSGKEMKLDRKLDHLFVTTSEFPKWAPYMELMRPFGKIYPLTVSQEDLVIPFMPLLMKELSFVGSCSSTPNGVEKMLEFAAFHGIKPVLQAFPFTLEGVSTAIKRLQDGEMRYRGVLKV